VQGAKKFRPVFAKADAGFIYRSISPMITYHKAETIGELEQILDLQQRNLAPNISREEAIEQGFLTVKFDLCFLGRMCGKYRHIIAKHNDKVVGYSLVMLRDFRNDIPLLVPMFEQFDRLEHNSAPVGETDYFVMGQVCVDKEYRGQGIFSGLYLHLRQQMQDDFPIVLTEIATRNTRSMKAHGNVGFRLMKEYVSPQGEAWAIVYWDWN
jgi:ribosomal protein S18 acetylase RimI-like enzyme